MPIVITQMGAEPTGETCPNCGGPLWAVVHGLSSGDFVGRLHTTIRCAHVDCDYWRTDG
jgi:hypothetical protein